MDTTALRARIEAAPRLALQPRIVRVQVPAGQELGMVSWVTRDPESGHVWILQRGKASDPVLEIDEKGRVLRSFGRGAFVIPHAIRLDGEGHVWTVDAGSSEVIEWTREGKRLLTLSLAHAAPADFGGATDVAFTPGGGLLVSDGYANARIVEFSREGRQVRTWGSAGTRAGQFELPHALVMDERGKVYVADRENGRIEVFSQSGRYVRQIAGLGRIYAVALGPRGTLWASVQGMDEPPGSGGWMVKLDRTTGRMLGYVAVKEKGGLHTIALDGDGQPITDMGNTLLWFQAAGDGAQPVR